MYFFDISFVDIFIGLSSSELAQKMRNLENFGTSELNKNVYKLDIKKVQLPKVAEFHPLSFELNILNVHRIL